jgi:sortase A
MTPRTRALSLALLVLGGLLTLSGTAFWLWTWLHAPPAPAIAEAGAVVAAETAPPRPTQTATPVPSPFPAGRLPTPALLPEWEAEVEQAPATAASGPATSLPHLTSTPKPTPPPAPEQPPTRIVAPAIGLDAKVVPMGWEEIEYKGRQLPMWVIPERAAGWHVNSALPGHGQNVVLSGHHNIEGKVFRYVVNLRPGDEITLYVGDTPYPYIVTEKYILKEAGMPIEVRQKNAQWIMPTGDDRLTLVTCWPYEWPGNTHRVIVVARPPGSLIEDSGDMQ